SRRAIRPLCALRTARRCAVIGFGPLSAYLFLSDLQEHAQLSEDFARFTDVRPSRPSLSPRQVVLISFERGSVNALGRMVRGRKAANYKWHVTLDEIEVLEEPLPLDQLSQALSGP